MSSNEKKIEHHEGKGGDKPAIPGAQITKSEDSALKQRQEMIDASKAFRFTKGDNAFTIQRDNGEKVQDRRPQQSDIASKEQSIDKQGHLVTKETQYGGNTHVTEQSRAQDERVSRDAGGGIVANGIYQNERGETVNVNLSGSNGKIPFDTGEPTTKSNPDAGF